MLYLPSGYVDRAALGEEGAREMVDLLTPLAKTYGTDMGSEIASLGIQVHGGMGFIEETGAAQYYRDIRIAADLRRHQRHTGRRSCRPQSLGWRVAMSSAGIWRRSAPTRASAALAALAGACAEVTEWMIGASVDDRLAGSYAYTQMMAVATSGWLMVRQLRAAQAEQAAR